MNERSQAQADATGAGGACIAIVDDDPLFRESIAQNLLESGYRIASYGSGRDFIEDTSGGARPSLVLLDWKMPQMNGIEVLRALRGIQPELPVIFLTVLSDQIYEEAALLGGAVDFVEKSRSFSIILRRIENILERREAPPRVEQAPGGEEQQEFTYGALRLDLTSRRAFWRGRELDLTLTEFSIVELLSRRQGKDVSYREIYDAMRGRGFHAGFGSDGYRANVRSAIKRIRQKLRSLDADFEAIENYPGFGYRWRPAERK
jgi:two-component system response regulator ChvI